MSSLIMAVTLLLWVEAGVAMVPVSAGSAQCRDVMQHMRPATTSAMQSMASGCARVTPASNPPRRLSPPAQRPDCCSLSNPPTRPLVFVITRGAPIELSPQGSAGPEPLPLPSDAQRGWASPAPHQARLREEDRPPDLAPQNVSTGSSRRQCLPCTQHCKRTFMSAITRILRTL